MFNSSKGQERGGGPFNDMQIGTWNAGGSDSGGGHNGMRGGGMDSNGHHHRGDGGGRMGDHHNHRGGGGMPGDRMDRGMGPSMGGGPDGGSSFEIGTFFVPTAQNGYGFFRGRYTPLL